MEELYEIAACLSFVSRRFSLPEFLWVKEKLQEGFSLESAITFTDRSKVPPKNLQSLLEKEPRCLELAKSIHAEIRVADLKVTYPGHEAYSQSFLDIHSPPVLLTYYGNLKLANHRFLSVVGSRNPSHATYEWMEEYLSDLVKKEKVVVVSGAARGVDQRAHALALRCKKPTIAFLPSGLKSPYPIYFSDWIKEIASAGGAVVSEYQPFQEMRKHHFCQRNRLISALCSHLLMLDVAEKSGSIMTANYAIEQNKELGIVPGHALDKSCHAGLRLLSEGASLIYNEETLHHWLKSKIN